MNFLKKHWVYLTLFATFLFQFFMLQKVAVVYDINSAKFWQQFSVAAYLFVHVNVTFFAFFFLITKKIKTSVFLGSLTCSLLYYLTITELIFPISKVIGTVLITYILPFHFVEITTHDDAIFWTIPFAFYVGVAFIIYGYFFIKEKGSFKNKFERKIVYMGTGLYLALIPFAFFVTHFTSVGSYYQYGLNEVLYTQKIIKEYESQKQIEDFKLTDLKYFKDFKSLRNYYESELFIQKTNMQYNDNEKQFYTNTMNSLREFERRNWDFYVPKIEYDKITKFKEWVQFAYNFSFNGVSKSEKFVWFYDEVPVPKTGIKEVFNEVTRHGIFMMHEDNSGGFYGRLVFDRNFRDNNVSGIFNWTFLFYHFVFLTAFRFLFNVHSKRFSKKIETIKEENV